MQKIYWVILIGILTGCNQNAPDNIEIKNDRIMGMMENSLSFFTQNAWDADLGTFYSELDNEGRLLSDKIYTVALGRLIYGLAYSSAWYPANLEKAKQAAAYQLRYMVGEDEVGKYFMPVIENGNTQAPESLDFWQQSYGFCGLTELYRQTQDPELLKVIHELYDAFIIRFHDPVNKGFYSTYDLKNGQVKETKSLKTLMYPVTAFIGNLWLADTLNRNKYEPVIKDHLAIGYKHVFNTDQGWVNVYFTDDWQKKDPDTYTELDNYVIIGHNFQFASLLLRASGWGFLSSEEKQKYTSFGNDILATTLKKPIWHEEKMENGFYDLADPKTDSILSYKKTWWQHCEILIALSLSEKDYVKEIEKMESYFYKTFCDWEYGGEYFYVYADGTPVTSDMKGSPGKSAYHTVEMLRFLIENKKQEQRDNK